MRFLVLHYNTTRQKRCVVYIGIVFQYKITLNLTEKRLHFQVQVRFFDRRKMKYNYL